MELETQLLSQDDAVASLPAPHSGSKQSGGGRARAQKLTPGRRSEIALLGAGARWASCSIVKLDLGRESGSRQADPIVLPRRAVHRLGANMGLLRWHMVDGEAMRPTFDHGDIIIVSLQEEPQDGAVHVVAANHGVVLRRVRARPGAGWVASCDNPEMREQEVGTPAVVGVVLLRIGRP